MFDDDEEELSLERQERFERLIKLLNKILITLGILTFIGIIGYFAYIYYPKAQHINILYSDISKFENRTALLDKIIKSGERKNRTYRKEEIVDTFYNALGGRKSKFINDIRLKIQVSKESNPNILINNIIINYKPQVILTRNRMLALLDTIYHIKGVTKIVHVDDKIISVVYEIRK